MSTQPAGRRSILGVVVAIGVGILFLIAIAETGTRIFYLHWSEFYSGRFMQLVTPKGHRSFWIGKPGFNGYFSQNNGDFRHALRINDFGLRNDDPVESSNGRVWMLGDSMTFGWGVEREDSFTGLVATRHGIDTYNVGSPGNDVCGYQALVDRMPKDAKPRAVVVGLIIENDITLNDCRGQAQAEKDQGGRAVESSLRSWASIKYILTGHSALYNVLAASVKRLPWLVEGLTWLGVVARPHNTKNLLSRDETEQRARTTVDEIARILDYLPPGTPMVVMVVPTRFEIRDKHPYSREIRTGVLRLLTQKNIATIDLYPGFEKAGFAATHFVHDGHWSRAGHIIAADAIGSWLAANGNSRAPPTRN